jgi:hypothetical protein
MVEHMNKVLVAQRVVSNLLSVLVGNRKIEPSNDDVTSRL